MKAAEKELASLRSTVEVFPKQLEDAVNKAMMNARRKAQEEAAAAAELVTKDRERERQLAAVTIKGLEEASKAQAAQIANLERQLAQAVAQAQKLAVTIIEASGRTVPDPGSKPPAA